MNNSVERVVATPEAVRLIERLRALHGPVIFHQSGGCCDGSNPMCYPDGELMIGDADVRLGTIGGAPFYMSVAQFEYWKYTKLVIDVAPGRGGMFSLESSDGVRFLTRSEMFTDAELSVLAEQHADRREEVRQAPAFVLAGRLHGHADRALRPDF